MKNINTAKRSVLGNMILRQTMGRTRKEDKIRDKVELIERIREECKKQNSNKTHKLDLTMLDVSEVEDMSYVFSDYYSYLESIDVSNWDTGNVWNMNGMFYGCSSLKTVDVSKWNVCNIDGMYCMFKGCKSLKSIDVSKWNTGNIKYMGFLFSGCSSLVSIDVSNWDVGNVEDMCRIFYKCYSLEPVDVSKWDVSNVKYMDNMFYGCKFDYKKEYNRLVRI